MGASLGKIGAVIHLAGVLSYVDLELCEGRPLGGQTNLFLRNHLSLFVLSVQQLRLVVPLHRQLLLLLLLLQLLPCDGLYLLLGEELAL